tara:strand:- start:644 stop:1207 length:564 start_codon:yes stop_codon:yes gene_type:complete
MPKSHYIFTFYLFVMIIIQFFTSYLSSIGQNNLYLSHYYFIFQFILLSFFYLEIINNSFQRKIIKIAIPFCLFVLGIQYFLNNDLYEKFNLLEIFITSFFIIIFSMFHFYNILNEKKRYYYLNTGILLYLFGSTVLFLSGNLISRLDLALSKIVWILNLLLYIVYQIFILLEWREIFYKKTNKIYDK